MDFKKDNYIPIYFDLPFKFLFGTQDNIKYTKDLLSTLLNIDIHEFDNAKILNSVKLDMDYIKNKRFELDIKLATKNNDAYLIEMQKLYDKEAEIKNFMYIAYHFGTHLKSGESYTKARSTQGIEFIKEFKTKEDHEIVRAYKMVNIKDSKDTIADNLFNVVLTDVEKDRKISYNNNRFELWRRFIGADTLEEAEEVAKLDPVINSALKEALVFMNNDYVNDYSERERLIKYQIEALKEDVVAAKKEEKYEIAKNLMNNTNNTLDQISLCTGLSLDELKKLKDTLDK